MQVVTHVRNMEEMGEILLSPVDGLHDELAAAGRQAGVDIVYAMGV